jgi:hypothetical protein
MVAHHFDPSVVIPEENATTYIQTGDVIYTHYEPGVRHGHPEPLSEVYWAYDRYARPTIPGVGLPSTANIFGRFIGDPTPFYEVCERMLIEGAKQIEIASSELEIPDRAGGSGLGGLRRSAEDVDHRGDCGGNLVRLVVGQRRRQNAS